MDEQRIREIVREEIKAAAPCTCQYGAITPKWYITVKTCPRHHDTYDVGLTPRWWNHETNECVG